MTINTNKKIILHILLTEQRDAFVINTFSLSSSKMDANSFRCENMSNVTSSLAAGTRGTILLTNTTHCVRFPHCALGLIWFGVR